jgi:hypothetical protein
MKWSVMCAAVPRGALVALVASTTFIACATGSDGSAGRTATQGGPATTERCLLRLHGKGGGGTETVVEGDTSVISPDGNSNGWGGRQWLYFPDDEYQTARDVVDAASAGCAEVIINGFSNGAAFAAKLYCQGETLDGRLIRLVLDDPVVDAAVQDCDPDPSVGLVLYWTGALDEQAQPGWDCGEADWTCEGGRTVGIDAYAEALRTRPQASPYQDHEWFLDAPELEEWR